MMQHDATAIWILGDLFDFWYEYFWEDRSKNEYEPILTKLREITTAGIDVHFFIGNHDIWTFGSLSRQTGMIIHRKPQAFIINNKRIFMGHGDGIVPADYIKNFPKNLRCKIRKFIILRKVFHNPILQFLFRLLPPKWANAFGYEWARRSRIKELAHPHPYKGENKEELVLWAKENQDFDYYIFGHRHIELQLQLKTGAQVIILGDMFRQWTYAKMDEDGQITICNYEE